MKPALAAALLALALYAPSLGHGFVFDDGPEVVENRLIRSLRDVPRLFAAPAWAGAGEDNPIYRPLTSATYALNYAAGGLSPAGYHALNVLLHALASLLVALLALRLGLGEWPAAAAGLLFAAHPVHVEAVANVAGRKDELAAVLVLAALLAHDSGRRAWAALALLGAMFAKETGAAGLLLLLAWDTVVWRRAPGRIYAVYAACVALYLGARYAAVGSLGVPTIPFDENPLAYAGAASRVLTAVAVVGQGLLLLSAPVTLSPDYSFDAIPLVTGLADARFLAASAIIAVLAALAWRLRPRLLFLLVFYAVTLLPGSNLLFPVGTIFGERLLYLPSVAFCLAVARIPRPVALAAVAALAVRTLVYLPAWRDEASLFAAAVRAQPRSEKAHRLHAAALMETGHPAEAAAELEEALRIIDGSPMPAGRPQLELGVAYEALGRLDEAARLYQGILARDPGYADAEWRLGDVRWAQGLRGEAVALWQQTLRLDPKHARAMSDLGIAAYDAGDVKSAETWWRRALEAEPRLTSVKARLDALHPP